MRTKQLLLFTVLFTSVFIYSCKKESKTVPVQLLLTDKPAVYDSVNIHIQGIKVNINHDSTSWISIDAKDTIVNLLDLQNGVTMLLAQDNLPDGNLNEVRFILGGDNTVVINGISYPLETPSAESSGLKVKINQQLNETLNVFTLDFDASESVKGENGTYWLEPVITLKH